IFDAMACGTPIISDHHDELEKIFPSEILYYSSKDEMAKCLEKVLLNYDEVKRLSEKSFSFIEEQFSFKVRAEALVSLVNDIK
ncbi:MAG: glycosyltransferase, partial [Fulvivirga sp.]|uniref:glycosyltransferase n=1 Tax=Fulvivirga sp. TaxID=1931237 RepID=UPI0032EDE3A4